ncbi:MAG: hypothetical protein E7660_04710 [Ruminococcaceae bacterium]|nr:hypothetical protein [Oscillospiraceae bacterium]
MKRIISIVLALFMLASLAVTVSAQEAEPEWSLSEDGKTLADGTNEYMLYSAFSIENFSPEEAFVYEEAVTDKDFVYYDVTVPKSNNDIICLAESENWFYGSIYVTVEGKKSLDALCNSMYGYARICNYNVMFGGYGDIDVEFLMELDSFKGEVLEINVRELAELDTCSVYVYDSTDTIEHLHGDVYMDGDNYYYINYDALDNSYFDADGYFSYRSGTVAALKLNEDQVAVFNKVSSNLEDRYTEYDFSGSLDMDDIFSADVNFMNEKGAGVFFWIVSAIIGFAVPLAIGVLGIVFALSKKPGKNKKWLALPVLSLLWMLVFAAIIVVLII